MNENNETILLKAPLEKRKELEEFLISQGYYVAKGDKDRYNAAQEVIIDYKSNQNEKLAKELLLEWYVGADLEFEEAITISIFSAIEEGEKFVTEIEIEDKEIEEMILEYYDVDYLTDIAQGTSDKIYAEVLDYKSKFTLTKEEIKRIF
jgi:hypothetical protein